MQYSTIQFNYSRIEPLRSYPEEGNSVDEWDTLYEGREENKVRVRVYPGGGECDKDQLNGSIVKAIVQFNFRV